jgi:hypothetical protein
MAKKMTIADLIAQKEQLKKGKSRTQTLYIESLDAEITIEEPSRAIVLEALEMGQDDTRSDMADVYVVYHCVIEPNLKDARLQKEFGCAEPTDIVGMIFRAGEIGAISGHALQLAGYGQGVKKVDDDIKN